MELNSTQNNEPKFAQLIIQEFVQKKSHWTIVGVTIAAVVMLFVVWWYVREMKVDAPFVSQPQIKSEAREDAAIGNSVDEIDLGNVDLEFQSVDQDLNSL